MEVKYGKYHHGFGFVRSHGRYSKNHKRNFFLKAALAAKRDPRFKRRGSPTVRPFTLGVHSAQLTFLMLTVLSDTKGHFACHVEVACTCLERMQYFKIKCLVGDPRRIQVPKK
nr:MAG TPA: hypothetical protein [Bacteriophage sp.]